MLKLIESENIVLYSYKQILTELVKKNLFLKHKKKDSKNSQK